MTDGININLPGLEGPDSTLTRKINAVYAVPILDPGTGDETGFEVQVFSRESKRGQAVYRNIEKEFAQATNHAQRRKLVKRAVAKCVVGWTAGTFADGQIQVPEFDKHLRLPLVEAKGWLADQLAYALENPGEFEAVDG